MSKLKVPVVAGSDFDELHQYLVFKGFEYVSDEGGTSLYRHPTDLTQSQKSNVAHRLGELFTHAVEFND